MEYASQHSLTYYCEQAQGRISEIALKYICKQILTALRLVHGRGFMHRAVSTESFRVSEEKILLTMFDYAK